MSDIIQKTTQHRLVDAILELAPSVDKNAITQLNTAECIAYINKCIPKFESRPLVYDYLQLLHHLVCNSEFEPFHHAHRQWITPKDDHNATSIYIIKSYPIAEDYAEFHQNLQDILTSYITVGKPTGTVINNIMNMSDTRTKNILVWSIQQPTIFFEELTKFAETIPDSSFKNYLSIAIAYVQQCYIKWY